MKLSPEKLDGRLGRPDPAIRFYLLHGPDDSASRAFGHRIVRLFGAERDAFPGADLKGDAGGLVSRGASDSLFGDVRMAWVEPIGDESIEAVARLLDSKGDVPAIGIAGQLRPTNKLLQLVEKHGAGVACASWPLEGGALDRHVMTTGAALGLDMAPDIAREIGNAAGADQSLIARELEKYALYLDSSPDRRRRLDADTIEAVGARVDDDNFFRLGDLAVGGRIGELAEALASGGLDGKEIALVRSLQRRMLQLAPLRAQVEAGRSAASVAPSSGRGLSKRDAALLGRAVERWTAAQLASAVDRLAALEKDIMLRGAPDEAAAGEVVLAFARHAARPR